MHEPGFELISSQYREEGGAHNCWDLWMQLWNVHVYFRSSYPFEALIQTKDSYNITTYRGHKQKLYIFWYVTNLRLKASRQNFGNKLPRIL
jgi:hypothetical protein